MPGFKKNIVTVSLIHISYFSFEWIQKQQISIGWLNVCIGHSPPCFQMCSKETREAPGTGDQAPNTVAAPARFENKPTFRQSYAKPELVK